MRRIVTNIFVLLITFTCFKQHQCEWRTSDFVFKAINISRNAIEAIERISAPQTDITVLHIVNALSIKRLYRIVSANSQLTKYKHIVVYWIPNTERSEIAAQDIATLYELLPAETIKVIDIQHFNDSEKDYLINHCSGSQLYSLLAAEVHRMDTDTDVAKGNHSLYWLLDIDLEWIGDLSLILDKLSAPSLFASPFSLLLSGIEGIENFIDTRITDYLFVGINHIEKNSTYSSTETLHVFWNEFKLKFDEMKDAYDQKMNYLDQFVSRTFEEITNLLNLNNTHSVSNKQIITIDENEDSFYWPEILRFSGKFLNIIRDTTFSSIQSKNESSDHDSSQISYWDLIDENMLKTYNALEYGLKEGLLARDFVLPSAATACRTASASDQNNDANNCINSDINRKESTNEKYMKSINKDESQEDAAHCIVDSSSYIDEKEFESLKLQFLKDSAEPFLFEKKAGTIFRHIKEVSSLPGKEGNNCIKRKTSSEE